MTDKIYPSMVIRSQAEAIELLEKENQQLKKENESLKQESKNNKETYGDMLYELEQENEKLKREIEHLENEIRNLKQQNQMITELGDHYKHLYSEVKKQKDDVVEYIKKKKEKLHHSFDEPAWDYLFICNPDELLRMLGEIDG